MPNKPKLQNSEKFQVRTAILVDGGFYRKRAQSLLGYKPPKERANELEKYCIEHLRDSYEHRYLFVSSIMIAHLYKKLFIIQ